MSERRRVFDNVLDAIGDTPIVRLNKLGKGLQSEVFAKLEFMNPGGSVKDRIAKHMLDRAAERGDIQIGGTIIEGTSGNTGMGLAMAAAVRGYQATFVMPDKQSIEKVQALRAFGAKVVVTPTAVEPEDPRSYYSVSRRLAEETPNNFFASQYHNPDNPETHYLSTGPEIWAQMAERLDVFVAGCGTGGTITGVGKFLKEVNPKIKIIGVDPVGSLYYDFFKTGKLTEAFTYTLEGIGEDFLPSTMDFQYVDDVVRVTDRESFVTTREVVRKEGLFVGGSCGAAVAGALKWLRHHDAPGQQVLVLLPDTGRQYLGKIFNDDWMRENGYLDAREDLGTVKDLLGATPRRKVICARFDARLADVAALMRQNDVSRVPVLDAQGEVMGIVSENNILQRLVEKPSAGQEPVEALARKVYSVVDADTSLSVLGEMFTRVKLALVIEGGEIVNVLTKIDLIDHISRASR